MFWNPKLEPDILTPFACIEKKWGRKQSGFPFFLVNRGRREKLFTKQSCGSARYKKAMEIGVLVFAILFLMNKITVLFTTVFITGAVVENCFKNIFVVFRLLVISVSLLYILALVISTLVNNY